MTGMLINNIMLLFSQVHSHNTYSQPRWLSGLTRSCVHSQWLLVDQCVLSNWDRILVRAVKGLISRAGMVSICPLLWQRDVKLQQTNKHHNTYNVWYAHAISTLIGFSIIFNHLEEWPIVMESNLHLIHMIKVCQTNWIRHNQIQCWMK